MPRTPRPIVKLPYSPPRITRLGTEGSVRLTHALKDPLFRGVVERLRAAARPPRDRD